MSSSVRPLDPVRHGSLCIDPLAGAAARPLFQIGLSEIALAAADMPLCLTKDAATGRFNLIALTGLISPANLFVLNGHYQATYRPRAAMLTAFRLDPAGAQGLAVDEQDSAIGSSGESLFDAGQPRPILEQARMELDRVVSDVTAARDLLATYADHRLIRPLRLTLQLQDGQSHGVEGLYTIDEEALADLDDADVVSMHRADRLAPATVIGVSLAQVERLRQLHNAAREPKIIGFELGIVR